MNIKKYKSKISINKNQVDIIGYLIEQREYLGNGCYSNNKQYLMYVTEYSMPNSEIRGGFIVNKDFIFEFTPCYVCGVNEVKEEFFYSCCSNECYKKL